MEEPGMKKPIAALVVGAGMTLFVGQAMAVEPYLPKSPLTFARLDANGDGKIALAEITPKAERRLLRYDTDNDGAVSAAEIDAIMQKALERRRARIMFMLDVDKDGIITEAELDKFVEAMFNGADADKDGGVTIEEAQNFKLSAWKKALQAGAGTN
jgi:Ca2+-binding EF-hand superfamily protein